MKTGDPELSNVQLVGLAGAASGAVAGAIVAVGRARRNGSADVRLEEPAATVTDLASSVTAGATSARRRLTDAGTELSDVVRQRSSEATAWGRHKATQAAHAVPMNVSGGDLKAVGGALTERADVVRGRTQAAVARSAAKGQDVTQKAKARVQRAGEQTASTAQAVASQAATAAAARAERARDVGSSLAGSARVRVPQLSQKVSEEVVPSLRDVAVQAAATALERWQTARERAAEVAQQELAPQAAQAVAKGSERAKEASAAVAERATEAGGRAREASRKAAEATVDTSKETGALLFWAGAAAGLVFYALMSAERREQVTRTAKSVTAQVQELVKDFQGYDDEF